MFVLPSWDVFSPSFFLRRTAVDSAAVEMFHGLNVVPVTRDGADQVELKWNHISLSEVDGRVAIWSKFELVEVALW